MNLEQRVANLEVVTADLKQQFKEQFSPQVKIISKINLFELRKKRLQKRLEKISDLKQHQAVLSAEVRLDCSVQSLRQLFQA